MSLCDVPFVLILILICFIVSDGNFNRSMLPYNNYQSGLRAGRAQMKTIALETFEKLVSEHFPEMDEEERKHLHDLFKHSLEK